jgi:putative aldouronate transport system permease protein
MYFGGGMIPHYILIRDLNMINTMWALIIPGLISTYNMILMRSFFSSIPEALREAAIVDGANDATTLVKIILPLSKSMLATIALFYAVGRWNGVQDGMIYINDPSKYILQVRLKNIIISSTALTELMQEGQNNQTILQTQQVRSAALVFSLIPVMIVYPFLQKYFVKGVMIGSVKG